ncbi:site-specific integrase [Pseudooceanicola algae]|nr:hypothetical protein [Pseudooceanicola algae]
MLDETLHKTLPSTDVAAFFKAELRRCVAQVRQVRLVERMDGSLTHEKARRNHLETIVLRGMIEDGLREEMSPERLAGFAAEDRDIATEIHHVLFREFLSPAFNTGVKARAQVQGKLSQLDTLHLRWAAVEARTAAHEAAEAVPLHSGDQAREAAVSMLREMVEEAVGGTSTVPAPPSQPSAEVASAPDQAAVHAVPALPPRTGLTPGVSLIEGRMTGAAILAQIDAARAQPEEADFDGSTASLQVDRTYGDDIAGTAVRMTWRMKGNENTRDQRLSSVALFMYLTGVQRVSEIRQHNLDSFAKLMRNRMPAKYWRKEADRHLTGPETMAQAKRLGLPCGLAAGTIERHINTVSALLHHAKTEENVKDFTPNLRGLIPEDTRAPSEMRAVPTLTELQRLFSHTLWQGCKSRGRRHQPGDLVLKDHNYWISLLLAYTGARRSEIAGLLVDDFGEEDGIPFIDLRPNHLRGLKNASSTRRIPLHPHILELGFADHVRTCRKRSLIALFPEVLSKSRRHLSRTARPGEVTYDKQFGNCLDHPLRMSFQYSLNGNPRGLSGHGFRHYVNDHLVNLRRADGTTHAVSEIDRMDLLGHTASGVNLTTYRRPDRPLGPLHEAIKSLPRLF